MNGGDDLAAVLGSLGGFKDLVDDNDIPDDPDNTADPINDIDLQVK